MEVKHETYGTGSTEEGHCTDVGEEEINFRSALYEKTLASCGFGYFQIILFLVCGWALASDSVEVQVVSFVLPTACDLEMTSHEKGWLNSIVFVGMMIGGYLLGGAADVKGRRYVLLWSMSINGVFGLSSAFAPNFSSFLFLRFLSGIGVGAALPILFSYCAEFINIKRRGPVIGFLACFWMVGNILTCIIAWLILPNVDFGVRMNNIFFGSWRLFVVVGAIPSITSVLFMMLMPESPMFLTKHGRYNEAYDVFVRIFRRNFGSNAPIPEEIERFSQYYNTCVGNNEKDILSEDKTDRSRLWAVKSRVGELIKTFIKVFRSTRALFVKPHTRTTLMLIAIWCTLSFGFYGLWMWFPEIFRRVEAGGGSTCTHHTSHIIKNVTSVLSCTELTSQQKAVYVESLLVAISSIPGNFLTIALVNNLGRRPLMAASMILSAVSVFFFSLVTNRAGMIAMSCIFSGISVAGWNVLDMLSIENYPTELRSTAFGVQSTLGRVAAITGNVAFGALVDQHCAVPLLLVAILLSVGGLVALKLPKTDDSPLT